MESCLMSMRNTEEVADEQIVTHRRWYGENVKDNEWYTFWKIY